MAIVISHTASPRFYIDALVERVGVGSREISISGSVRALEKAIAVNEDEPLLRICIVERNWRARHDNNGHSKRWGISVQLEG